MFLILSGSSGVGKNTVINVLKAQDKRFQQFVTYTTRQMREGEVDGVNYHFVTKETFMDMVNSGDICEYELIHGNYYGSALSEIDSKLKEGYILIKDIGVEGQENLKKILSDKYNVKSIFLTAPKEVLIERLIGRGETQIELRMSRYDYEQEFLPKFDKVINNFELQDTVNQIIEFADQNK